MAHIGMHEPLMMVFWYCPSWTSPLAKSSRLEKKASPWVSASL